MKEWTEIFKLGEIFFLTKFIGTEIKKARETLLGMTENNKNSAEHELPIKDKP